MSVISGYHPSKSQKVNYYARIKAVLDETKTERELHKAAVNAPFIDKLLSTHMGLGITVLLLVNKKLGTIDRIAISDTDLAREALLLSPKKFEEIKIPLTYYENILAKAIHTQQPQKTDDWKYLYIPELTPEQARFNQAGTGIACSIVFPLKQVRDGGALIFSYYKLLSGINGEQYKFMDYYANLVGTALSANMLA